MHGRKNIKLINAEQAKPIYQYKDTKIKLYKNNAAIWYNKTCEDNMTYMFILKCALKLVPKKYPIL